MTPEKLAYYQGLEDRLKNKRRKQTHTPTHWVSSVDLVIEHPGGMYGETMVFKTEKPGEHPQCMLEVDGERYRDFDEAAADHDRWVEKYGGKWES